MNSIKRIILILCLFLFNLVLVYICILYVSFQRDLRKYFINKLSNYFIQLKVKQIKLLIFFFFYCSLLVKRAPNREGIQYSKKVKNKKKKRNFSH